jgi:predicted O-methyltransferase YrrM
MKNVVKRVAKLVFRSSPVEHVMARLHVAPWLFEPPGHFYSPIPALDDVRCDEQWIFPPVPRELPGIALDEARQLAMLDELQPYYDSQPFHAEKTQNLRYFFENPAYLYSDAIFLHCMIRHARPRRIIEVGSGYSSCVMLDTNELFFDNRIACTFVEPYPQLLRTLLRDDDLGRIELLGRRLQEITLDRFRALEANDILFIDSTHVAKIGSDVNHIFADILPILRPGVYVHFHDIFYPFEYPKEWIYEGRAWNEAYLLRAFLTFNRAYEIVLFNTFLERFHRDHFMRRMPLCLKNEGGSIWLRRD